MRWGMLTIGAVGAFLMVASAAGAGAAELVMYRRQGCPWCAAWDREIGPVYPKTDVGRSVPLRMVDLDQGDRAAVRLRSPIRYTPTFVLVDRGREVGRVEGYPGDAFFWGLLERLVEQLPSRSSEGKAAPHGNHAGHRERPS